MLVKSQYPPGGLFNMRGTSVLQSKILEFPDIVHGFSTREKGERQGTLYPTEQRQENLRKFTEQIGCDQDVFMVKQLHGDKVVVVKSDDTTQSISKIEADALVTNEFNKPLAIRTADCVPVLFADPMRKAVAAVHAGWRGTAKGVLQATIHELRAQFGCTPEHLYAAIGPCIGPCCYVVGQEVLEAFAHLKGVVQEKKREKGIVHLLDLGSAVVKIIEQMGIPSAQIDYCKLCTKCYSDLFYSYRRDGAATGRQFNVISLVG